MKTNVYTIEYWDEVKGWIKLEHFRLLDFSQAHSEFSELKRAGKSGCFRLVEGLSGQITEETFIK